MMAAPSGKVGSLCLPVVGARVLITAGMVAPPAMPDQQLTAPAPILPSVPSRTESAEIDRFRFRVPRV